MKFLYSGIFFLLLTIIVNAGFDEGKKVFEKKCSSCHGGYIPAEKIKENFFEKNNTLLNLKAPSVNMLAYAIIKGPKHIGDPNDPEMREAEIEEYLKEYLSHPERSNSICDRTIMRYYEAKPATKGISDDEYVDLAAYFMHYHENRKKADKRKSSGKLIKKLTEYGNEKQILQDAKKSGKVIIIEAESKNCHYCKRMKKNVIENGDVQSVLRKGFIFVSVDVGSSKLPFKLNKVYKHITPSFFFLDSNGKLLNHYPGSWKKNDFLMILKENSKNSR